MSVVVVNAVDDAIDVGCSMVEDDWESDKVVIVGPGPWSPVREIAIDEKKDSQYSPEDEAPPWPL